MRRANWILSSALVFDEGEFWRLEIGCHASDTAHACIARCGFSAGSILFSLGGSCHHCRQQ